MALNNSRCFSLLLFALLTGLASSARVKDEVYEVSEFQVSIGQSKGRALLQAKTTCTVNFEQQNYTIITSQCKGPNYQPGPCCAAFKQFACPFADQISDDKTDCASTMFSYINLYGKYPPALFSSLCHDGKDGLECPDDAQANVTSAKSADDKSGVPLKCAQSPALMLTAGFLMLLFKFF